MRTARLAAFTNYITISMRAWSVRATHKYWTEEHLMYLGTLKAVIDTHNKHSGLQRTRASPLLRLDETLQYSITALMIRPMVFGELLNEPFANA